MRPPPGAAAPPGTHRAHTGPGQTDRGPTGPVAMGPDQAAPGSTQIVAPLAASVDNTVPAGQTGLPALL